MEETGKIKSGWVKKIFVILFISASLVLCLLIFDSYSGSKIIWDNERANLENGTGGQVQVVKEGPAPTCSDEIQNQGERHVDCGGPCSACPPDCSDGIKNQDETGVDCGGKICAACPSCTDRIQNQGERHIDCGGPCDACPPDCSDGIKNQDETGVDCGGKICAACPSCTDRIQNQGEGGVDCGGPCSALCPPTCSDGIQNQGETEIDCGGPCSACQQSPQRPVITSAQKTLISQTILASAFVKDLPSDGVIALRFYDFFLGERIWHDDILIGKTGILSSGTPDLVLIMHARYISQLNGGNLCEVIQAANAAGEMWTESQYSNTKLMLKYAGMLKYRDCFGF